MGGVCAGGVCALGYAALRLGATQGVDYPISDSGMYYIDFNCMI